MLAIMPYKSEADASRLRMIRSMDLQPMFSPAILITHARWRAACGPDRSTSTIRIGIHSSLSVVTSNPETAVNMQIGASMISLKSKA